MTFDLTRILKSGIFQAMAISSNAEEKRLQEQLARANRELSILYNVSNAMRTTLELNHILYIILTGVTSHTGLGFNRAALFLVNKKERCLECKIAIGPDSAEHADKIWKYIKNANQNLDDLISTDRITESTAQSSLYETLKKLKIPLVAENNLLASAFYNGSPLHIRKELIDEYLNDPLLKIFKTSELVVMPLKAKDKVNGLIIADNLFTQKPITGDDLKIFMMLANQAGLAIENSQLYELVVHRSHTDSLTNVWNHGFFQHTLSLEVEKSRSHHLSLCLLMIDIDNFKKLNDTWGHQNGDILLLELATILKESSREIDYVCRYGGEEFAIILTQTTKEQGFVIAERIRERIAQHQFPKYPNFKDLRFSVSIGLASFPQDAQIKEELIAKADKAMYIAKFGGKNRTYAMEQEDN